MLSYMLTITVPQMPIREKHCQKFPQTQTLPFPHLLSTQDLNVPQFTIEMLNQYSDILEETLLTK